MAFANPEQIIKSIGIELGMQVADFGSGAGFYAIPLAKAVGPYGKVYALDVRPEMLELTRSKARNARLLNISVMRADLEKPSGSKISENSMDLVLVSNILFQTENKEELLKEAYRILQKDGKIALIDWTAQSSGSAGPAPENIVTLETAEKLLDNIGFKFLQEFDAGDNHYGLLYQKPVLTG